MSIRFYFCDTAGGSAAAASSVSSGGSSAAAAAASANSFYNLLQINTFLRPNDASCYIVPCVWTFSLTQHVKIKRIHSKLLMRHAAIIILTIGDKSWSSMCYLILSKIYVQPRCPQSIITNSWVRTLRLYQVALQLQLPQQASPPPQLLLLHLDPQLLQVRDTIWNPIFNISTSRV